MPSRPNILFLIMDDQRPDAIGPESAFAVHTPHLDQLAAQGTEFRRHYVTTPICTPGRAEVLTGHHSYHNGVRWFGQPIRPDLPLLPRVLQAAGYHTIHVGKWHNDGHPRDKGYHVVRRAMHDSLIDYREHGHTMEWEEFGQRVRGHSTELFCDAAIEEIQTAPTDAPWFCYLALHSPHDPFQAPEAFLPGDGSLPDNFMPIHPHDNGDLSIRDELLLTFPRTPDAVREYRRQYAGMIQHHDHHLGRVIQHLKQSGCYEDTLIVFTSDHGLAVGDHGLLGKENMYEHSCRVPCLLRGPGIPVGEVRNHFTQHADFMPTLLRAAGIDHPLPSDGQDLLSTPTRNFHCCGFTSPDADPDRPLRETQRMIVDHEWKLILYPLTGIRLLFHLASDPNECDNLLASWRSQPYPLYGYQTPHDPTELAAIADRMEQQLRNWGAANNDPLFA